MGQSETKLSCCGTKVANSTLAELSSLNDSFCPVCQKAIDSNVFTSSSKRMDIRDKNGRWYLADVKLTPDGKNIQIQYIGWSDCTEVLPLKEAHIRCARAFSNTTKVNLSIGTAIELYTPYIKRWRLTTIASVKVSNGKTSIKVDNNDCEWILFDYAIVSNPGNHIPDKNPNEINSLQEFYAPNGIIMLSAKNENRAILEEASTQYALPSANGFQLFEKITSDRFKKSAHSSEQPELMRYLDAHANLVLERSVAVGASESERKLFANKCTFSENCEIISTTTTAISTNNSVLTNDMTSYLGVSNEAINLLLKRKVSFREALQDQWARIPADTRQMLVLADVLEDEGEKAPTVATRRFLFAEAAELVERVHLKMSGEIRSICYWRLCRHYIAGLGIDIIDFNDRQAADLQSAEYFQLRANPCGYTYLFKSLILSLSRWKERNFMTSIKTFEFLNIACEQGVPGGMYWKSVLLFEGWGDSEFDRKSELLACQRLLETSREFGFWPKACNERLRLVKAMVQLDCATSNRFYLLSLYIFTENLKSVLNEKCKSMVIALINTCSLRYNLPGIERNGNISEFLNGIRERFISFKPSAVSDTPSNGKDCKDPMHNNEAEFKIIWLRQRCNEYFAQPNDRKWEQNEAKVLAESLFELNQMLSHICKSLDGTLQPIDEVSERIHLLDIFNFDMALAENVSALWFAAVGISECVFNSINPNNRFLKDQVETFEAVQQFMKLSDNVDMACLHVPRSTALASCLEVINIARDFARNCGHDQEAVCRHHCLSALAVLKFAKNNDITFERAKLDLKKIANEILKITPNTMSAYSIGFHVIVDSKLVIDFMNSLSPDNQLQAMTDRINFLNQVENMYISTSWRQNYDRSLLDIFHEFRQFVNRLDLQSMEILTAGKEPCVCLDYAAISYADPWQFAFQCDVDGIIRDASEIIQDFMVNTGLQIEEATEQYLTTKINEKLKVLIPYGFLESIQNRLHTGYVEMPSRILLKKKFLYMLENIANINWLTGDGGDLVTHFLNEGLSGRCPDGINAFCDSYILNLSVVLCRDVIKDLPDEYASLICSIANFVLAYKTWFKRSHLSRYKGHFEGRTVGDITLNYMLLLPLALPGNFGVVKYPRYATEGHANVNQMKSDEVISRYFKGGNIKFTYPNGNVETVSFPQLDMATLIAKFRRCIVRQVHGIDADRAPEHVDLLPRPILDYTIEETIIENCVKKDVILGPFYAKAQESAFTMDNLYFKSIEASDTSTESTMPVIARIMRDSAIVRLFEICNYVKKSFDFDKRITSQWKCTPFVFKS